MDLGIQGRVALVLGAGGGLGSAIALGLAINGVKVALADIDTTALARTKLAIESAGGEAEAFEWDLSDLASVDAHVTTVEVRFGQIDILVNNTGGPPPTPVSGQTHDLWRSSFEAMVLSIIAISDRILPGMRQRKWGRVVTSTSSGIISPIPNLGISNALRLSLVGWSKTLAREVAAEGVTANIIAPGRIATGRIRFLDEAKAKRENRSVEEVVRESTASIPAARYGRPDEYADAVAFLASERAAYITGTTLRIDGGMIASI